jgi:serine/threonine-protein kinase HSL1 (negative regulator of Swe1 kinase)
MSGALANESTISVNNSTTSKHAHFIDVPIRTVQPQARNWFARLLHIQPARRVLALQTSVLRTRRDILVLFRNWKQHGMTDIVVDKVAQRIWARVSEENPLGVKPVSLACEIFPIFVRGRKANLCLARFTQEKGAKSTFERVINALEAVLRKRGAVVGDKKRAKEMKRCLQGR